MRHARQLHRVSQLALTARSTTLFFMYVKMKISFSARRDASKHSRVVEEMNFALGYILYAIVRPVRLALGLAYAAIMCQATHQ
jgi:hypothetical protein